MKKAVSEYDQRQYQLMLEQIDSYLAKKIDLNHIRVGLEARPPPMSWSLPKSLV
jgi:hypothetical protein